MKILILTDDFGCGGAQTHISTLVRGLHARGHHIIVASSGGEGVRSLCVPHLTLPLDKKEPRALIVSLLALDALVQRERFDIIHAHARLPALLSSRVAKKHGICFVTTVHARFPLSPMRTRLSRWGSMSIAVSEDLKQYLVENYRVSPENVEVIPNGIDTHTFTPAKTPQKKICIATLSRLDTDCALNAHLLCFLAPALCRRYGKKIKILIGGGGNELISLQKIALNSNKLLGFECINVVGAVHDVPAFLRSASVFVGVGRAAIEAALCEIPTVICGNEGFFGKLTSENFSAALSGNFCARDRQPATAAALLSELAGAIASRNEKENEKRILRKLLIEHCGIKETVIATENFYRRALFHQQRSTRGGDVVLCGYYGYSNLGDDALLRSAVCRAEREFGNLEITALTKNGKRDSAFFGIDCRRRTSPFAVLPTLKHAKYFIFGGGTLLQDSTSLRSLLFYSSLLLYAKANGADCRIWGGGIGKLTRPLSVCTAASVLRACSYCGLRDEYSFNASHSLLNGNHRCVRAIENDLAKSLTACTDARAEYLLSHLMTEKQKQHFLLVAPNGSGNIKPLCHTLKTARRNRYFLLFAVMHHGEDSKICHSLATQFGGAVLEHICFSDLIGIAKKSRGVYSMRLHTLIAADMANVPAKAFGNDVKLREYKSNP